MTAVFPEAGTGWDPWADFDAFEELLTATSDPVPPMRTVDVDGVPMVPAARLEAAYAMVARLADENRRRVGDLTIARSTRLVDVEADAMVLALDLIRGYLAEPDGDS